MAFRTVAVDLVAKVANYKREMASAGRSTKDFKEELNEAAKAGDLSAKASHEATRGIKGLGTAADKAGDDLAGMGRDAGRLDKRIGELQGSLRELFAEFDKTGDLTILDKIKLEQRDLNQFIRLRKQFGKLFDEPAGEKEVKEVGAKAGAGLAGGIIDSFSKSMSAGGTRVVAAVVGAAAAAAPFLGASISAAVVGGVGLGGIVGGIAAASRDPRVRAEAEKLGVTLSGAATTIGEPFIGPTIESIRILNEETDGWITGLNEGLTSVAPVLKPLTEGLDGLVDELMPGLVKGLEAAKPALRALSNSLPELGEDLSAMFKDMAANPEATAAAMHDLVLVVGETARGVGVLTKFLSSYYEVLLKTGEVTTGWANDLPMWVRQITPLTLVADFFDQNSAAITRAGDASRDYRSTTEVLTTTQYRLGGALQETNAELDVQRKAMRNLVDVHLSLRRATQDIEEAIDSFSESVAENGRSLDITTEKGRNNRDTIEASIDALDRGSKAAYDNAIANGATAIEADEAAKRYREQWIPALVDAAVKAGFNRDQVAGLFAILDKLNGRVFTYTIVQRGGRVIGAIDKVGGGFIPREFEERRWGGITVHAQTGVLRDAGVFSPQTPARYAFAEPSTGGEAFVPRFGDYQRSMSILSQAAGWYGATLMPGGGGMQTVVHEHRHTVVIQGREMLSGFRREVDLVGGKTDNLLGRKRA